MLRLLAVLFLLCTSLLAALLASAASAQEFDIPSVTIAGGDLPYDVTLAVADADAFRRRVNQLPRLEDPPAVTGKPYAVSTAYWTSAVPLEDDEDEADVTAIGDYYPEGGFVRVSLDGDDVWMVLSLRQRAILDRYIRLAEEGLIDDQPDTLQVLLAAAEDEQFGIQLGNRALTKDETTAFWSLLSGLTPLDVPFNPDFVPPEQQPNIIWIAITLPEGRSLRFVNDAVSRTLAEPLSQEVYPVSKDWLSPILGAYDSTTIGTALSSSIEQEEPAGSWVWWPVTVGGGLAALGVALLLRWRIR